jgi:hypothetical protein
MLMHYFSCSGLPSADMWIPQKNTETRYAEQVFLPLVQYTGHVVYYGAPTQ